MHGFLIFLSARLRVAGGHRLAAVPADAILEKSVKNDCGALILIGYPVQHLVLPTTPFHGGDLWH